MKRKIVLVLIMLLAVVFSLSLMTCDNGGRIFYPWKLEESKLDEDDFSRYVELSIFGNTSKKKGINLIIKNNLKEDIFFGEDYFLQIRNDGVWQSIAVPEPQWNAERISVAPGEGVEIRLNWTGRYGELPGGEYRVVKSFNIGSELCYAACEFKV